MKKIAFTLAEIMIVLSVIAILTAILLPSARNAMPNENIIKFKKAHNALHSAIQELVNSDKYYSDGDLAIKADGQILSTDEADRMYLCQTLADILTPKEVECSNSDSASYGGQPLNINSDGANLYEFKISSYNGTPVTQTTITKFKGTIDYYCQINIEKNIYKQIIMPDGVWIYDPAPRFHFGAIDNSQRYFSAPNTNLATIRDENGFDTGYKILCIDIDGWKDGATRDKCKNTCPFGYGVRADGKIINGERADEWLAKSIQEK